RLVLFAMLMALLMTPALRERLTYNRANASRMVQAWDELRADQDRAIILSALRALPPGRTYAGMASNWGRRLNWGYLRFYNLLTFENFDAVCSPYYAYSLNSDLMWEFDDNNPEYYRLFNVRYTIAPATKPMPAFLKPIVKTKRYTLYQMETGGYTQLAGITAIRDVDSQSKLLASNRRWIKSPDPAAGRFIAYAFAGSGAAPATLTDPDGAVSGIVANERAGPQRIGVHVEN